MSRIFSLFAPSRLTKLGPLEQHLLDALWQRKSGTVRELIDDANLSLAYTTVMTTLDRLYKKNLLDRVAEGRAFRYSLRYSPEEMQRVAAGEAIRQLLGSQTSPSLPLSCLVEAVSEHDTQLLDELQEIVERKRRELRGKEKN
jgi:predicted transcriptional regulator